MFTLEAHGSATVDTMMIVHWIPAVVAIAGVSMADATEIVGRDRLARWWRDGMTVAMAADSLATWIKLAKPQLRADAEAAALRRRIALGNSRENR